MYSVTHKTKRGGSGVMTTNSFDELRKKVVSLFKQRLTATVYRDGNKIGWVAEDDSCRLGWNWSIDKDSCYTLHDLAMNFHSLMVDGKAKYFTIDGCHFSFKFWYITDVRQDGTYPCHPTDENGNVYSPLYFDYKQKVTIHF